MYSAQHDMSRRFHPKLARLEDLFRDIMAKPFDAETLVRLMRMEVETSFPGLNEHDQGQVVDIVLEHMQAERPQRSAPKSNVVSNVVTFPHGARSSRG